MKTINKEMQEKLSPRQSLELLKKGNDRFLNNKEVKRDLIQQMHQTSSGQYPFAVILSCIDSRVPAEIVFDQGLGDIFNIRVAGNIVNNDVLACIEFACKLEGSKVVLVMGHTKCGAIKGACDDVKLGHLTGLFNKIKPAIDSEKSTLSDRNSSNNKFIEHVSRLNVISSINQVLKGSDVIEEMVAKEQILVSGAMYCIDSGRVEFFD